MNRWIGNAFRAGVFPRAFSRPPWIFEGVPLVLEIYDNGLQAACELYEFEGALRCLPIPAGISVYGCGPDCPTPSVLGRPKTDDCGPAYWPYPDLLQSSPLVRLNPIEVDDDAELNAGATPVAGALLDTYGFDGEGGEPVETAELVAGTVTQELNADGSGVQVWTGDDGSRLVLGPYDARYGPMAIPQDAGLGWLEPTVNALVFFADDSCTQRLLCDGGAAIDEAVPRVAGDGEDLYRSGPSVPGDAIYFGSEATCNGPSGPFVCFEAIGPLDPATDYPAIERTPVAVGDVSVDVLALASGERLGLAGALRDGSGNPCVARRVGDSFRCLPPPSATEFAFGPFSVYADPECTVLALAGTGELASGEPYYRTSVGTCDPGGELYAWVGQVADPTLFFATPSGCNPTTSGFDLPWHTYEPTSADQFPAFDGLEVF